MKRAIVLAVASIALAGCGQPADDATRRFDAAFWETWFLHMSDADRKAVCWEDPALAAETYAAHFDANYLPTQQRAEHLFTVACSEVYE